MQDYGQGTVVMQTGLGWVGMVEQMTCFIMSDNKCLYKSYLLRNPKFTSLYLV